MKNCVLSALLMLVLIFPAWGIPFQKTGGTRQVLDQTYGAFEFSGAFFDQDAGNFWTVDDDGQFALYRFGRCGGIWDAGFCGGQDPTAWPYQDACGPTECWGLCSTSQRSCLTDLVCAQYGEGTCQVPTDGPHFIASLENPQLQDGTRYCEDYSVKCTSNVDCPSGPCAPAPTCNNPCDAEGITMKKSGDGTYLYILDECRLTMTQILWQCGIWHMKKVYDMSECLSRSGGDGPEAITFVPNVAMPAVINEVPILGSVWGGYFLVGSQNEHGYDMNHIEVIDVATRGECHDQLGEGTGRPCDTHSDCPPETTCSGWGEVTCVTDFYSGLPEVDALEFFEVPQFVGGVPAVLASSDQSSKMRFLAIDGSAAVSMDYPRDFNGDGITLREEGLAIITNYGDGLDLWHRPMVGLIVCQDTGQVQILEYSLPYGSLYGHDGYCDSQDDCSTPLHGSVECQPAYSYECEYSPEGGHSDLDRALHLSVSRLHQHLTP